MNSNLRFELAPFSGSFESPSPGVVRRLPDQISGHHNRNSALR